jgi:hypothetical protein
MPLLNYRAPVIELLILFNIAIGSTINYYP